MLELESSVLASHIQVIKDLGVPGGVVEKNLKLLTSVDKIWQPADFLPDFSDRDKGIQQLRELWLEAEGVSRDLLVVLVGNMITEEGLPSYQTTSTRIGGIQDETGADEAPWPQFTRAWTAEENRHGVILNTWATLSGRVNMREVQKSIQHLIRNGFTTGASNDPYEHFVYTSAQEEATELAHKNTALLAEKEGCPLFGRMGRSIASDESRHGTFYKNTISAVFERDLDGAMTAVRNMLLQKKVVMPAALLNDGLFYPYSQVAANIGVYTRRDYINIVLHLMKYWRIKDLSPSSDEAKIAQEELVRREQTLIRVAERGTVRVEPDNSVYRWINDEQTVPEVAQFGGEE